MIKSLTKEQQEKMPSYVNKWLSIGLDNKRANRSKAEAAIAEIYKQANLAPPTTIEWVQSPIEATKLLREKYKIDKSSVLSNAVFGNHSAGILAFYDYFLTECSLEVCAPMKPFMTLAEECNWFFPYDNIVVMCEKPIRNTIMNGLAHNDYQAATEYADGFKIYDLRGVVVPEWVVLTPANEMNPKDVLAIENVDVRREAMRKIGLDKLFHSLDKTTIDTLTAYIDPNTNEFSILGAIKDFLSPDKNRTNFVIPKTASEISDALKNGMVPTHYELVELQLTEDYRGKFLKMGNPSIDAVHVEGVPNEVNTVLEAIAFRNGEALTDMGTTKIVLPKTLS